MCLKKALPGIFKLYSLCDPHRVLAECGLFPEASANGCPFPTFFFDPDRDGISMIQPHETSGRKRRRPPSPPVQARTVEVGVEKPAGFDEYRSQELLEAYEAARVCWDKPSNS